MVYHWRSPLQLSTLPSSTRSSNARSTGIFSHLCGYVVSGYCVLLSAAHIRLSVGLQAADKAVLGTSKLSLVRIDRDMIFTGIMAIFGLREDTGLIGQQYSWRVLFNQCIYIGS